MRWLAICLLGVITACGATPKARGPASVSAVIVVQIDGLSRALLDGYRHRPSAHADDRLLARLTAGATAWADIGVAPETSAALLVTEATPATLNANTPPLFDLLPGADIAAGVKGGKTTQIIDAKSDAERVSAILAAKPAQLTAVRLTSLAEALAKNGRPAGPAALAKLDIELARLRTARPDAMLVITGTAIGPAPHQPKFDQLPAALANSLKVSPDTASGRGLTVRLTGLTPEQVGRLDAMDFTRAVFHRTPEGMRIHDADLGALRTVHPEEFADWPDLLGRLERAIATGDTLAIIDETAVDLNWGGPETADSAVPILVDGPGVGALPARLALADMPALIRAALTGGTHAAWRQLSNRPTPAKDSDWARCVANKQCDAVVARSTQRAAGADALVAAKAIDAARWLDPTVPVAADGPALPFKPAARYAFGDEPKGFETVDAQLPSAAHAALIARVTGADVIAWQDSAVIAVPYVHALGGPAYFSGPLMEADRYAAFARGVRALQLGDVETATAELKAADALMPAAQTWRDILMAFAAGKAEGVDEVEYPKNLKGWPNVIASAFQLVTDHDEDNPPLPPLPVETTAEQRALYAALVTYTRKDAPCSLTAPGQASAMAVAADQFERAGLLDFAASAAMNHAMSLADFDEGAVAVRRAMALAAAPEAALTRGAVYSRMLLTIRVRPQLAMQIQDEIKAAARLQLFEVQRQIALARAHGEDGVHALLLLVDGQALSLEPDLVRETIDYAVDGKGAYAAKVVQSLLTSGLISSLLQSQGVHQLRVTHHLMERALQSAPLGDSADERVAQTMPALIKAVVLGMEGMLPQADQTLALVDEQLQLAQVFAAREASMKAAGAEGEPSIAAWGPYMKAMVLAGRATIAFFNDQNPAAEKHIIAFIEVVRRFTHAELTREGVKGFQTQVDGLAKVLVELTRYGLLPEKARASKAATNRILKAARDFPLDAPEADATVRPWLRLAGIWVHDVAWLLTDAKGSEPIAKATTAMDALVQSWRPESSLGRAGLFLMLAVQHAMPDLGKLIDADSKLKAMDTLPKVRNALQTVVTAIRQQYPANTLKAALQSDKAERVFIEHILTILEQPKLMTGDRLPEAMAKTNSALRAAAGGKAGDVRDVLLFIEAHIAQNQDRPDAEIKWLEAGQSSPSGPAFSAVPGLWSTWLAGAYMRKGDRKSALKAISTAEKACPALTHRFALARAVHLAMLGDSFRAKKAFKQARLAARQAGHGRVDLAFKLAIQDNLLMVKSEIDTGLLGTLLGKPTGSFQLGGGGTSESAQSRLVTWQLNPQGTPSDAVIEALALEAWTALSRGDHGTAGTALSGMVTLLFGVDARHLDETPAKGLPAIGDGAFSPRSPWLVYWVGVLAQLHGFEKLGTAVNNSLLRNSGEDWEDAPGGRHSVCDGEAPASASPVAKKLHCQAPSVLVQLIGKDAASAMEAVVRARASQQDIKAARTALAEAMPTLLPKSNALKPIQKVQAGDDAQTAVRAAVEAGFTCELALIDRAALRAQLIGELEVCGPAPMRVSLVGAAMEDGNATTILETIADGLRIEHNITADGKFAKAAWPLARETMSAPAERARLAKRAATFAQLARELDVPREAAWFDALTLAAAEKPDPAKAKTALVAAWNKGLRAGEPLKFFKLVMADRVAEARKAIGL